MDFRTIVTPEVQELKITHNDPILMLGSCFADNMGERFSNQLFDVVSNPFGALYNPLSILSAVKRMAECREFHDKDLFEYQGQYHSFDCHSHLSSYDKSSMLRRLNDAVDMGHVQLMNGHAIFLTFGSTKVFERNGMVVANCHKLPSSEFTQRTLILEETTMVIQDTINTIKNINPAAHIVLNVSPVRHIAYGAHANQISKSTLLLAIDECVKCNQHASYFPSYELLLDDLRDYRYYDRDMCHPSPVAADYIYEAVGNTYFSETTKAIADQCRKFTLLLQHRPMTDNPEALEAHHKSINKLRTKLLSTYPFLEKALSRI